MRRWRPKRDRNGLFAAGKLDDTLPYCIAIRLRGHYSAWASTQGILNDEQQECFEWIHQHIKSDNMFHISPGPRYTRYRFSCQRDAAFFKLRWGGNV